MPPTISGPAAIANGTGTLLGGELVGGGVLNYGNLTVTGDTTVNLNSAGKGGASSTRAKS